MSRRAIHMRGGVSVQNAMIEMAQEAADQAAVNALNTLAQWVHEKGHPDLATEMLATFGAPSEGDDSQAELELAQPDPEAAPAPSHKAPPEEAILITGEH
jgi:hypothetical protein